MHHFTYRDGRLHAEDVDLATLAEAVGTPFYCYSTATLERHYNLFANAVGAPKSRVFYAMKANSNLAVLQTLARLGAGADTVSEGEIRKAMAAGISASAIVFSGVGKADGELAHAVDVGLHQVNIETEGELHALSRTAAARGRRQDAVFRINPDIGAGGHAKITTGSDANKFGISLREAERLYTVAANLSGIRMVGLRPEIVQLGNGVTESDLTVHDETDPTLAYVLSRMWWPDYPVPVGVLRRVSRPTHDQLVTAQVEDARAQKGEGDLRTLLFAGDTWTVA